VRPCWNTVGSLLRFLLLAWIGAVGGQSETITLHTLRRVPAPANTNEWQTIEHPVTWDAQRTAMVLCDLWDAHWCPDANARVAELAPRVNAVISNARSIGVFIIHCPSDTMTFYKDHPGRRLAQAAPETKPRVPLKPWCARDPQREPPLPIDDSDEGCDGCPDCKPHRAWSRQHPAITIADADAITDSAEAYHLMRQRGITNVIVMGVHVNMCVLGRPFGIRQMVAQGQNVVLLRDLTDAMYNHRSRPWVSHFRGTELVIEHIEKYWCPTATSADLLGDEPFRFKDDIRKRIVLLIAENEYRTWETLPAFATRELAWRGYTIDFVTASQRTDDFDFQNWTAILDADLLVISARRRAVPEPMLDALRAHVAAAKPVVGLRTASHAFDPGDKSLPEDRTWRRFDREILGAQYQNHYGSGSKTVVRRAPGAANHPLLNGVNPEFQSASSLYRSRHPASTVTLLLEGQTENGQSETEPVAWINLASNRRVFYTSLGSPGDFDNPSFRRLLLNGILWALDDVIPPP